MGRCLFNLLSVCLKELEHKVKKLNCKKWGGGGGGGSLFTFLPCIVRLIRESDLLERESSIEDLQ